MKSAWIRRFIKLNWTRFTDRFGNSFIHPQFIVKRYANAAIDLIEKYGDGDLLDVGCGTMSYKKYIEPLVEKYTGLDYPLTSKNYPSSLRPDIYANAKNIPSKDDSYDCVIMLQVLEHIDEPLVALKEAHRVLKKKKYFVLSVPFMYPVHDAPNDYFRYTEYSLKKMAKAVGFKVIKIERYGNFLEFIFQSIIVFLFKRTKYILETKKTFKKLVLLLFLLLCLPVYIPFNFLVVLLKPLEKFFPKHKTDFPLVYSLVAQKN